MGVYEDTEAAVESARAEGIITAADEGAVSVLLVLADRMDEPDFPMIDGRFDNVTEALYFKAADALGLTPAGRAKLPEKKGAVGGKLAELRSIEGARGKRKRGA